MTRAYAVANIAYLSALIPLGWLPFTAKRNEAAWWWLAVAFGVSFLADTAAHWADPFLVGLVYPVSQATLIAAVLRSRADAAKVLVSLTVVAIIAALLRTVPGPDVVVRTVAWCAVVWIAWPRWELGRLRTALLVTFGAGWLTWLVYATWPGWSSYLTYQGVRLLGYLLFCWAAAIPHLKLRRA